MHEAKLSVGFGSGADSLGVIRSGGKHLTV